MTQRVLNIILAFLPKGIGTSSLVFAVVKILFEATVMVSKCNDVVNSISFYIS